MIITYYIYIALLCNILYGWEQQSFQGKWFKFKRT
jgi:hypothetical protein